MPHAPAAGTETEATTDADTAAAPTDTQVQDHLAFATAGLALGGHEITDPVTLAILEQAARHLITTDQALAQIRHHIQR